MLKDKKIIAIGDRDGIPAPAIEECVKSADAEVIFASTKCFSCSSTGAMDSELQQSIKDLIEKHGAENVAVVLGGAEAETCGLSAETVSAGDPTFAGPLAGITLGLAVYHLMEPEIKNECDAAIYDEQCGLMEMVLDVNAIISEVKNVRNKFSLYK